MSVHGSTPHHPTVCDGCKAAIWFGITPVKRKYMPLDATPNAAGNVAVHQDAEGTWIARVVKKEIPAAPFEKLYMPHFATCTGKVRLAQQVRSLAPVIDIRTRQQLA